MRFRSPGAAGLMDTPALSGAGAPAVAERGSHADPAAAEVERAGARVAVAHSGVWSECAAEVTSSEVPVKSPRDRNT